MVDSQPTKVNKGRRDFLMYATLGTATVAGVSVLWPVIDSMNPSRDVLALGSVEVDLSGVPVGGALTIKWRGKPIFIRHRTKKEIKESVDTPLSVLRDPQPDSSRVKKGFPQWLVVIGICTHLGCIPLGQKNANNRGKYGGWFCPCHGSNYDTAGRIRIGPAPLNLAIPSWDFLNNSPSVIKIG